MAAGLMREMRGLGYMQPSSRLNFKSSQMIPAVQLIERNAKAISNGDLRVAFADRIKQRMDRRSDRCGGHNQCFHSLQRRAFTQLISRGQLGLRDMILARN